LRGDVAKFEEDYKVLGTHISHAYGKHQEAQRGLDAFSRRVETIDRLPGAVEKQLPPLES